MLILIRVIGETVFIGDDITVTILGIAKNRVLLGINAHQTVCVYRDDVYSGIKAKLLPKLETQESIKKITETA